MAAFSLYRVFRDILRGKYPSDGTKLSGFVTEKQNKMPRECGNCRHFIEGSCRHPVPNMDPETKHLKHDAKGFFAPDSDDCCNFFQNKRK